MSPHNSQDTSCSHMGTSSHMGTLLSFDISTERNTACGRLQALRRSRHRWGHHCQRAAKSLPLLLLPLLLLPLLCCAFLLASLCPLWAVLTHFNAKKIFSIIPGHGTIRCFDPYAIVAAVRLNNPSDSSSVETPAGLIIYVG